MLEDETKKVGQPFDPPEFFKKFMSGQKQGSLDEVVKSARGGDFADAYAGSREDLAIWKNRALTAEKENLRIESELSEYVAASQRLAIERAEFRQENERLKAPPSVESERARFELWFSDHCMSSRAIEKDSKGHYLLMQAAVAWVTWQTATKAE
jgi:hypothetical protein